MTENQNHNSSYSNSNAKQKGEPSSHCSSRTLWEGDFALPNPSPFYFFLPLSILLSLCFCSNAVDFGHVVLVLLVLLFQPKQNQTSKIKQIRQHQQQQNSPKNTLKHPAKIRSFEKGVGGQKGLANFRIYGTPPSSEVYNDTNS